MEPVSYKGKTYAVDSQGFLLNYEDWDENFPHAMTSKADIPQGLTDRHWNVIRYIRDWFKINGECPLVYQACRANGLSLKDLKSLFPTGYQRGACLLAGITSKDRIVDYYGDKVSIPGVEKRPQKRAKVYRVDLFGFLVDPSEWDEDFALQRAHEMKIPGGMTKKHWKVIQFLRDQFEKNRRIPTVFQCCEANDLELDELERLFPSGYHRGAVKIAGLRAR